MNGTNRFLLFNEGENFLYIFKKSGLKIQQADKSFLILELNMQLKGRVAIEVW